MYYYDIELRDKEGNLYKDSDGNTIVRFQHDSKSSDVEKTCKRLVKDYQAISKEGSEINIEVSVFNSISNSYMVMYSYYGNEKRFVKHK